MSPAINPHSPGCPWYELAEKFGAGHIKYCEETLCSWIAEPANTWSNLIFIIVAILLMKISKHKTWELKYFPYILIFLGLSSFYYHMSNTYFTQIFDYVGMFLIVYWLVTLNTRLLNWSPSKSFTLYTFLFLFSISSVHLMAINGFNYQLTIVFAVIAVLISQFFVHQSKIYKFHYKYLGLAFLSIGVGHTFSLLDMKRIWCDPSNHWLQGHGLWHIFSAICFYFAFKHWDQFGKFSKPIK